MDAYAPTAADETVVTVQETPIDTAGELAAFQQACRNSGGIATFIGQVRGDYDGERIHAMTLEHYPGMTEKKLAEIAEQARNRWALEGVRIVHRYGRMLPGEHIVFAATAAPHRHSAFAACEFLMDWLKTCAPFWKLEETDSGERWVEAKTSDDDAAARWGVD